MAVDPKTGSIAATATAREHEMIRSVVEQMTKKEPAEDGAADRGLPRQIGFAGARQAGRFRPRRHRCDPHAPYDVP